MRCSILIYPVTFEPDTNGTLLVTFPDVPEAITYGSDRTEALLRAEEALVTVFMAHMDDREPIPAPG